MRAALSILSLVVVLAVVLFLARQQARQLTPPAAGASAVTQGEGAAPAAGGLPRPAAVGAQVQGLIDQSARDTAAAAASAAGQ